MAERLPQNEQSVQDSRQGVSATFYKIMVTATIQVDMYNVTRRVVENWVWHKATKCYSMAITNDTTSPPLITLFVRTIIT